MDGHGRRDKSQTEKEVKIVDAADHRSKPDKNKSRVAFKLNEEIKKKENFNETKTKTEREAHEKEEKPEKQETVAENNSQAEKLG